MSESKHTPEPWSRHVTPAGDVEIRTADHRTLIAVLSEGLDWQQANAGAWRIVAAVNGCEGISTEALEAGVIKELLAELEFVLQEVEAQVVLFEGDFDRTAERARLESVAEGIRKTIAKAKGEAQ